MHHFDCGIEVFHDSSSMQALFGTGSYHKETDLWNVKISNNNDTDQTGQLRSLVCGFVVSIQ